MSKPVQGITVRDVAKKANVSTATVSRALNDDPRVLPETKERVLKAVDELGYVPNEAARALRTKKTRIIGFVTPQLADTYLIDLAEMVEGALYESGFHLLLGHTQGDPYKERDVIDELIQKGVSGLIVVPTKELSPPYPKNEWPQVPIVSIDRKWKETAVPAILTDNENSAHELTLKLLENLGGEQVAFLGGPEYATTARQRYAGFLSAWQKITGKRDGFVEVHEKFTQDAGYSGMEKLWRQLDTNHPVKLFAANYHLHLGATLFLSETQVPYTQVEIAAFDRIQLHRFLRYAKYFINQPAGEIARVAADVLLNLIAGEEAVKQEIVLKGEIIDQSTNKGYEETK